MIADPPAPDRTAEDARQLVQQARAALAAGEVIPAQAQLQTAAEIWSALGESGEAAWCRAAAATLARHLAFRQTAGITGSSDPLLTAASRFVSQSPEETAAALATARAVALEERDPIAYLAVAVAQAQLAEASGDRTGAYTSLATAWVTLEDALGAAAAERLVAPQLIQFRQAWGERAFAEAKGEYERAASARRSATPAPGEEFGDG